MTDLVLLATLLDGPKHGYQLKKQAGMIFGQRAIHNNLVYPLLRRFTASGWVTRKTVPGERGQKRQQYAITRAGIEALVERLSDFPEDAAYSHDGFRLRVALFPVLAEETRARILSAREAAVREVSSRMEAMQVAEAIDFYPREVLQFTREQLARELAWIHRLQKMQPKKERKHA